MNATTGKHQTENKSQNFCHQSTSNVSKEGDSNEFGQTTS
jgi:hypothetical protein